MKQQISKNLSLKFIIFIILMGISTAAIFSQDQKESVSIGIVLDGKWEGDTEAIKILREEINSLLSEEYSVSIQDSKIISGEWNFETIKSSVTSLLNDQETDIILAVGEYVSRIVESIDELNKPVITIFILDPNQKEESGTEAISQNNLNKIQLTPALDQQTKSFKTIYEFNKAAVLLGDLSFYNSENKFDENLFKSRNVNNVELNFYPVGYDIDKAVNRIPDDIQAVIIEPLRFLSYEQFNLLTEKFSNKKIPVFTTFDEKYVYGNVLAGFVPKDFFPRFSRRIAVNIQRILGGEIPSEIPASFPIEEELIINMKTARELEVFPSWSVLTDSKLINDKTDTPNRLLSLKEVTVEALEVNLDLLSQNKVVEAGLEDISIARSYLLPQTDLSATGLWIDPEKAKTSFGLQPERSIFTSATLTQLIYDEKTWANLSINESQQIIREYELEQEKLDITLESAVAYLNVLRAKTYENIQIDNLGRTKANLEIANYRHSVGSGRLAETFRWENELATNRKSVIEANSNRNLAEINLNRILNRPLEESFMVEENDLPKVMNEIAGANVGKYLGNKWYFKSLRNFIVEEGKNFSPELKIINEAITIQERVKTSANNSFFLPTLALQGELNNNFYKGGEGSGGMNLSIPNTSLQFPEQKDLYWTVALNLSFSLFDGGKKFAEYEKSDIELTKLMIERESLEDMVEQNIRTSLHRMGSSFAGIEEANKSSEAANKNLELVVDAYSTGAASIVDLIDAQNSALVADEVAVDAVYNFLIDLLSVERSMGRFYYSLGDEERESFLKRLETYIENNLEY